MPDFATLRRHSLAFAFVLMLQAVAASNPASAQVAVKGVVLDPSKAVVVGASVELREIGQVVKRSILTGGHGEFEFDSVDPGVYEIHVTYQGFSPLVKSIQVRQRAPLPLKIILAIASVQQQATVTSGDQDASVETSDNPNSVSLSGELLDTLPIFDEDYVTALSRFLSSTDVGIAGPALIVNGVQAENLSASSSAIQEVKIDNPRNGHKRQNWSGKARLFARNYALPLACQSVSPAHGLRLRIDDKPSNQPEGRGSGSIHRRRGTSR